MADFTIDDEVKKAARDGIDFDKWWLTKDIAFRVENKNLRHELKKEYLIEEAAIAAALPDTVRCILFVYGKPDTGKSYATREFFRQLYGPQADRVINVSGPRSGAFDKATLRTDAIIFDSMQMGEGLTKDMLRLCDDGKPLLHRRHKGDVAYVGKYTVIVTDYSPREWLKALGNKYWDKKDGRPTDVGIALLARLTKIRVYEKGNDILIDLPVYSTCGTEEAQHEKKELADKYVDFLRKSCHYYATHGHTSHAIEMLDVI